MNDLCITDLGVEYRNGDESIRPIDGLNLKVAAGSLAVLLGPSGCGKTTLLSCLGGILGPSDGHIELGDVDITALKRRELAAYRRRSVGIVFQTFNLIESLSALENVMVPMWAAGIPWRAARKRAGELLTQLGLGDRMAHRPGGLSGGQRQRVAIARAIALDPPLILADEPTAHLDFPQMGEVLRLIRELASGERIVVVATHDTRILPLADQVVQLVPPSGPSRQIPETIHLTPGAVLFEEGSIGDLVYLVADGELEVVHQSPSDGERLIRIATRGDYVGEIGPLLHLGRVATVRARTDATVVGYSVSAFHERLAATNGRRVVSNRNLRSVPRCATSSAMARSG